MTNIEKSLNRINLAVKNRSDDAKMKNEYQWQDVKENDPQIAEFMKAIAKAFGKPDMVKVTLANGDVILDSTNVK